jgi:hypothetical protein
LTATLHKGRFVLILDNISANKSHASGKEAELERARIENRQSQVENAFSFSLPQKGKWNVRNTSAKWKIYRTRFLIKAQQLTQPLVFVDALGREHCGQVGDYLVESSDGSRRIAPREIFEDVYVAMGPADERPFPLESRMSAPAPKSRVCSRPLASA